MKNTQKILLILAISIIIMNIGWEKYTNAIGIPSALEIVSEEFLKNQIETLISHEKLKRLSPKQGEKLVNKAYDKAKKEVNDYYRERTERLIENFDSKFSQEDILKGDKKTKRNIEELNKNLDYIDEKRQEEIDKLNNQRDEFLEVYKSYWIDNIKDKKIETY